MKIAFILNQFPVLSATFIINQITGLIDLGHDIQIFAYADPHEEKVHPDVHKYNLLARTRYIKPAPQSKPLCMIIALSQIIANLPRGPVEMLKFTRMFALRKKGLSLSKLRLLIAFLRTDFDIIQCHYGPVGLEGIFLKNAGIKAKVCTSFHGYDLSRYPLIHGPNIYDELFEKGDIFLPISEYWKNQLLEMGCNLDRLVVHRMGIDPDKFQYKEKVLDPSGPVRILTIGRLVEKKGHEFAIKAIANLVSHGCNIKYVIAGDGPLRSDLETQVRDLHLDEKVTFLGSVDQDEVINLYRQAHIFLLPSVTASDGDKEGVPVVLMEAMAMGLTVVSTHHSGISELVIDGESGYLVPERDIKALTEKLKHLIASPDVSRQMANHAREYVLQNYNIKTLNRILRQIYQKATSGNHMS